MAHTSELEDFQDFSIATSWEAIAATIENSFHSWNPIVLQHRAGNELSNETEALSAVIDHNLPHRIGSYTLTLHLPTSAQQKPSPNQQWPSYSPGTSEGALKPDTLANGELRNRRLGRDEAGHAVEPAPSVGSTPASAYSDAESRSSSERPFHAANGELRIASDSDSPEEDEELEESPPLFPRRLGEASPTPSLGELGSASAARARWSVLEGHARLRTWFAVGAFVTLTPNSFSGRIMDAQEAHVLLSALAAAAASSKFAPPCFLPVHDGMRDAYWGIAPAGSATRHFETDSVHLSSPPPSLLQSSGLLALFAGRLRRLAPCAAASCAAAADSSGALPSGFPAGKQLHVSVSLRRTWQLPRPEPGGRAEDGGVADDDDLALWADQWDAGCAWWPWASQQDPCGGLELDLEWQHMQPVIANRSTSLHHATATHWRLHALSGARPSWLRPSFLQFSQSRERPKAPRRPLRLGRPSVGGGGELGRPTRDGSLAAMLVALWEGRATAAKCATLGQLASGEWWGRQGSVFPSVPSEAALQDVLRDLFLAPELPAAFAEDSLLTGAARPAELEAPGLPGCAPSSSLPARLAMHALTFSNPRAVATLWIRFVRELRFAHWEALTPLPRVDSVAAQHSSGEEGQARSAYGLDLRSGLLHQKLQMLNECILLQRQQRQNPSRQPVLEASQEAQGISGTVPDTFLLGGEKGPMRVPLTQQPPLMTEDMLREREATLSALGADVASSPPHVGEAVLASDMSAFKAANPGALLEDFVRWHSPRDWQPDPVRPASGRLTSRIGAQWTGLWDAAAAVPASRQKPLMDAELEGERVLHDFEHSLLPAGLWDWLMPVSLSAACACLAACLSSAHTPVAEELAWFRRHAAGLLQSGADLQAWLPQLLGAFQQLECLVVAAESLRLRLPDSPALVSRLLLAATGSPQPHASQGNGPEADSTPFVEPTNQVASTLLGGEEAAGIGCMLDGKAGGSGWPPQMLSEWVIEVGGAPSSESGQRLYAVSRTGELRVATSIVAEI